VSALDQRVLRIRLNSAEALNAGGISPFQPRADGMGAAKFHHRPAWAPLDFALVLPSCHAQQQFATINLPTDGAAAWASDD